MILHLATRKGERGAPAEYEPHEYADARSMYLRAASLGPCVERTELIGSILTMHELKTLLDARVLTETEQTNLGLTPLEAKDTTGTLVSDPEIPVQQTMIPPEGTESMLFKIPPTARKKLGMPEQDNQYDQPLSDPDKVGMGKWHAPEHGAPETERAAALAVYPRTGTQRRAVLDAIGVSGERGLTDEEVASTLGMLANTERPRRVELEQGGWITNSGRTRKTAASGSEAAVWVLTEQGRSEWRLEASA